MIPAEDATPYLFTAVAELRRSLPVEIALIGFAGAPFTLASYLIEGRPSRDLARTKAPEVALVDIGLPGFDGYEVARRMKALPAPPSVMIALTGYSEPEDRQRATDAGFAAHLVKPVDPDGLSRLLARLGTRGPGSRG